jgi:molybdate transport system substrate-binding protein
VRLKRRSCLILGATLLAGHLAMPAAAAPAAVPATVTIFAAASLTDAVTALAADFEAQTGTVVRPSFAASSALARQLEAGAPADLFFSADTDWMDDVAAHGLIRTGSRVDLLGNQLVLIAPRGSALPADITPGPALLAALGDGHWVTGDPDAVPVGRYAQAALRHVGQWDALAPRLVRADNVRAALALVARGEVAFGIVYATDARVEPQVRIIGSFPAGSHPPITYPVALLRNSGAAAADFLRYLRSPAAAAVFRRYGFVTLNP